MAPGVELWTLNTTSPVEGNKVDTKQILTSLTSVLDETDIPLRILEASHAHVQYHFIGNGGSGFACVNAYPEYVPNIFHILTTCNVHLENDNFGGINLSIYL